MMTKFCLWHLWILESGPRQKEEEQKNHFSGLYLFSSDTYYSLNFRKVSESKWEFNELKAKEYFFRGNFKLENLFKQVTKSQYNAHHAHADCEALLQVCLAYGEEFGAYMDRRKEEISIFQNK